MDKILRIKLIYHLIYWYECMSIGGVPDHDTCVGKDKVINETLTKLMKFMLTERIKMTKLSQG